MKKGLLIFATVLVAMIVFVSFSAVSADSNGPIDCVIDIVFDFHEEGQPPYWYGPVTGCALEGHVRYDADPERPGFYAGNSYHFYERFTIYPAEGGEIYGENAGTVAFSNFEFRANGWVTDATPEWEQLIGYKFHEKGTSSESSSPPIFALGTEMRLSPASRSNMP